MLENAQLIYLLRSGKLPGQTPAAIFVQPLTPYHILRTPYLLLDNCTEHFDGVVFLQDPQIHNIPKYISPLFQR
jgi:hypothetical protein